MVSHHGGSRNLEIVRNGYQALKALQFTADQIVRMVSHMGGSCNLIIVKNNFQALKDLGFTADQIVQMTSHDAGSHNVKAVINSYQVLKELHFTPNQIVQMVSHPGGSLNIKLIQKHYLELVKYQFSPDLLLGLMKRGRISIEEMQVALEKVRSQIQPDSFRNLEELTTNLHREVSINLSGYTGLMTHRAQKDSIQDEKEGSLEQAFNQELDRWVERLREKFMNPTSYVHQTASQRFFPEKKPELLNILQLSSDSLSWTNDNFSMTE